MIKSLHITNFRSYKDAFLRFSPGVNVIIGENDVGKTNIIRAINLVINNRPSGDDYISTFGGNPQIDLGVGNKTVTRLRSAKWDKKQSKYVAGDKNVYKLSGEKTPFKSFGMNVPDLIKQHLNISPVSIAFQLEGPFLLNKSAADVAKHYNNIVNLDVIDTTISNIISTLRNERSLLKVQKENEKDLTNKLKKYDWLNDAEISLINLEQMQTSITELETEEETLNKLIEECKKLERGQQELNKIIQYDQIATDLIMLYQTIRALTRDRVALQGLIEKNENLVKTKQHLSQLIKQESIINSMINQKRIIGELQTDADVLNASIIQIEELRDEKERYDSIIAHEKQVNQLIKISEKIVTLTKTRDALQNSVNQHKKLRDTYIQYNKTIEWSKKQFKEAMPELCPIFNVQCDYIDKAKND